MWKAKSNSSQYINTCNKSSIVFLLVAEWKLISWRRDGRKMFYCRLSGLHSYYGVCHYQCSWICSVGALITHDTWAARWARGVALSYQAALDHDYSLASLERRLPFVYRNNRSFVWRWLWKYLIIGSGKAIMKYRFPSESSFVHESKLQLRQSLLMITLDSINYVKKSF